MKVQPAAFLRTVLPLDLPSLEAADSGRYHSVWLPDHMVSFWPDSIWTPEFTDIATVNHSPHRQLDAMAVAGTVAAMTKNVPIATSVVDTVRRHPSMLAQTALTLSHLSKGRFILGVGAGELENTVPYGFSLSKLVSRFEESLKVIRLLWDTNGTVDFEGEFYHMHHARMDTEAYNGKTPPIWIGCARPRMLDITGRYADGWWAMGIRSPEHLSDSVKTIRDSAARAGRDPMAIAVASMNVCFVADDDAELAELLSAPMIKSWVLMMSAELLRSKGFTHPMGETWRGMEDFDPSKLTRDIVLKALAKIDPEILRTLLPCGTPKQVALKIKSLCDAGLQVFRVQDYSAFANLKFQAKSPAKIRAVEDEVLRLVAAV